MLFHEFAEVDVEVHEQVPQEGKELHRPIV
jgi:hypothetical protein